MANNPDSNKRVKVGLAIFAMLIIANIFVHGKRMLNQPAKAPIAATPAAPGAATVAVPGAAAPGSALTVTGPDQYIETKISELNQILIGLKDSLQKIPEPLLSPDLTVELVNSGNEFFKWQVESAPMIATPSMVQNHEIQSGTIKIIGQFTIGGQTRLLVQAASIAYIINKDETDANDAINLLPQENDKYIIKDTSGKTQEIVEILTGGKKQTLYPIKNR